MTVQPGLAQEALGLYIAVPMATVGVKRLSELLYQNNGISLYNGIRTFLPRDAVE